MPYGEIMTKRKMLMVGIVMCALVLTVVPNVSGSGFSSVTINTDKTTYFAGETMHVTITGTDSDTNPNDNYIDIYIYVIGNASYSLIYMNEGVRVPHTWGGNVDIPGDVSGTGWIYVLDSNKSTTLGTYTFTVLGGGAVSGALTLQPSMYTHTLTFVPGETLHITVHDCVPLGNYTLKIMLGTNIKYEVNITVDADGNYFLNYTIPESAPDSPRPDGTRYSVELYNGTIRVDRIRYDVKLYDIYAASSRYAYIPGETININYGIFYLKNHTLVSDELYGTWYVITPSGTLLQNSTQFRAQAGVLSFKLGSAADLGYYTVYIYYNDSATATEPDRWDMYTMMFYCGNLGVYIYAPTNGAIVMAGSTLSVDLKTYVSKSGLDIGNLPECDIRLNILNGAQTLYSGTFVSDFNGYMSFRWQIPATISEGTNLEINITVSKMDSTISKSVSVIVSKPVSLGITANLIFDRAAYLTGENVTLHVEATYKDGTSGNFSYIYMVFRDSAETQLLAMQSANNPDFTYATPNNFHGDLWFVVYISDNYGNSTEAKSSVEVEYAKVLISADKTIYKAGETLTFNYEIVSKIMKNPECFAEIWDSAGKVIKNMPIANGTFEFTIPDNPETGYTIYVFAQENGVIVSNYVSISELSGYDFKISLRASAYTTNVYKPGETVFITYTLKPIGNAPVPHSIKLEVYLYASGANEKVIETQELSGTISYTLPSDLPEGTYILMTVCHVGSSSSEIYNAWSVVSVNPNPSGADLNVGGMRAMDLSLLILFIIALVVAMLLFFIVYRKLKDMQLLMGAQGKGGSQGQQQTPQVATAPVQKSTQPQMPGPAQPRPPQQPAPPANPPKW
jgi:uncharacterized protein YfaS (alpha-2-macroglobulin family)